ncbi:MAG: hypothetical protein ACR2MP_22355 [Streptosporangiaceae bacterium]
MTAAFTRGGCPVDDAFGPLSPDHLADPYAVLAGAPAFCAPSIGYYVVSQYADVEHVFRDPQTYPAAAAQAPLVPLIPQAQEILLAGGHRPQPTLMGAPERDHTQLKHWCGYRAALCWGRPSPEGQLELASCIAGYRSYLRDPDVSSILYSFSFAGHETTTGLIGNTVRRLLEDPARWPTVAQQPVMIAAAVEETLRYDTPAGRHRPRPPGIRRTGTVRPAPRER